MGKLLFAFGMALVTSASLAQTFPAKTVTIVVPFPAGGSTDMAARALGQGLQERLGHPDRAARANGQAVRARESYNLALVEQAEAAQRVLSPPADETR